MIDRLRLDADLDRLRAMVENEPGRIVVLSAPDVARPVLHVELRYPTAASARYPAEKQPSTRLRVTLPARYPFQPPTASIETRIYHPNVFPSGVICLGTKWLPSEGLDLFLQRVIRLLCFDPLLVNVASPANREAADWYVSARRRHPGAFPTTALNFMQPPRRRSARAAWHGPPGVAAGFSLQACPACKRRLRLPAGRLGTVRCPACGERFETRS
jgi:ubiquitin-protein ligase